MDERVAEGSIPFASPRTRADAFEQLADRHLTDSYRLANVILGDPTEAHDAVHDAFVTAWHKWDSLRDLAKFERWFQRIVVNTCRDRLREGSRRKQVEAIEASLPTARDPYGEVHERMRLEAALARLKPDDQIVLALRYYRDLKVEDIAAILDVPPGTVMSRLHYAQQRLRQILDAEGMAR